MTVRRYMLDTNILSDLVRNPQGTVASKIAAVGDSNVCTSIIVASELRFGAIKRGSARLFQQVEDVLGEIEVLPLNVPADLTYGELRHELEKAGKPIGPNDMLIAAHSLMTDCVLVTANVGEFSRVRGLAVESWV